MVIELLPCCNLSVKLQICNLHGQDFWIKNSQKLWIFLRSTLKILHLTEFVYTDTLSVVRDKYEVCAGADADDEDVDNGNDNDDIIPCCKLCCRS